MITCSGTPVKVSGGQKRPSFPWGGFSHAKKAAKLIFPPALLLSASVVAWMPQSIVMPGGKSAWQGGFLTRRSTLGDDVRENLSPGQGTLTWEYAKFYFLQKKLRFCFNINFIDLMWRYIRLAFIYLRRYLWVERLRWCNRVCRSSTTIKWFDHWYNDRSI